MNCNECAYYCEIHGCTSPEDNAIEGCEKGKQFGGHYTHWSNGDYRACACEKEDQEGI